MVIVNLIRDDRIMKSKKLWYLLVLLPVMLLTLTACGKQTKTIMGDINSGKESIWLLTDGHTTGLNSSSVIRDIYVFKNGKLTQYYLRYDLENVNSDTTTTLDDLKGKSNTQIISYAKKHLSRQTQAEFMDQTHEHPIKISEWGKISANLVMGSDNKTTKEVLYSPYSKKYGQRWIVRFTSSIETVKYGNEYYGGYRWREGAYFVTRVKNKNVTYQLDKDKTKNTVTNSSNSELQ